MYNNYRNDVGNAKSKGLPLSLFVVVASKFVKQCRYRQQTNNRKRFIHTAEVLMDNQFRENNKKKKKRKIHTAFGFSQLVGQREIWLFFSL